MKGFITTLPEGVEAHPALFVTVKVKVPGASPDIVTVAPVPLVFMPPGFLVTIQVPLSGKPLNTTLPVAVVQVGWVMAPTKGAAGVAGEGLITTLAEAADTQPAALVTVKL
jgi:hypothetical protein